MPDGKHSERLQKYLSSIGVGSRRQIDSWVVAGRVVVDGRVAKLGMKVGPENRIQIDGSDVRHWAIGSDHSSATRVLLYNKPEGLICSRKDPKGRPSVFEQLPIIRHGRWISVGRLDINTCGLLLFTNNGDLAQRLMHPSSKIEREYLCRVYGDISDSKIANLLKGQQMDGQIAKFLRIRRIRGEGRNTWYSVIVAEGRYREVRRLWESVGCAVSRLNRIRFGNIRLPRHLERGGWTELNRQLVGRLVNGMAFKDSDSGAMHATHQPIQHKSKSQK